MACFESKYLYEKTSFLQEILVEIPITHDIIAGLHFDLLPGEILLLFGSLSNPDADALSDADSLSNADSLTDADSLSFSFPSSLQLNENARRIAGIRANRAILNPFVFIF